MASRLRKFIRKFRLRGLRTKLFLSFTGLIFFTTLIIGVVSVRSTVTLVRENTAESLKLVALMRAGQMNSQIRQEFTRLDELRVLKGGRLDSRQALKHFSVVYLFDSKGKPLWAAPRKRAADHMSLPLEEIRNDTLDTGARIFRLWPEKGHLDIIFSMKKPTRDGDEAVAVGLIEMTAKMWAQFLAVDAADAADVRIETLLVDAAGNTAFCSKGGAPRFEPLKIERKRRGVESEFTPMTFELNGRKHFGVAREMEFLPGWKMIVHQPYSVLYAQVSGLSGRIGALALLALAVASFLAVYRARRITRPLTQLLRAAEEIAEGDYSKRVSVTARDELGTFIGSFNRMTTTLDEKITELRESRTNLEEALNQLRRDSVRQQETDEELHRKIQEIVSLNELTRAVAASMDLKTVMETIAGLIFRVMKFDACAIKLLDHKSEMLRVSISRGLGEEYVTKGDTPLGEGISGLAVSLKEPLIIDNIDNEPRIPPDHIIRELSMRSLISWPLVTKQEVVGVLNLYTKEIHRVNEDERRLLDIFANQAASAIESARLFDTLKESYLNTIQALSMAIDAKDQYTHGHSKRVSDIGQIIGERLGLTERKMELLRHAGDLHDIGKIGISEMIISKSEKLTLEEFEIIKTHPLVGETIIEPVPFLQDIREVIRHHHERWDGLGYPDGLKEEEIPLLSRIILLADAYDAMTSDRPYRKALTHDAAVREIVKYSGAQFDPKVVEAFLAVMEKSTPEQVAQDREARRREGPDG